MRNPIPALMLLLLMLLLQPVSPVMGQAMSGGRPAQDSLRGPMPVNGHENQVLREKRFSLPVTLAALGAVSALLPADFFLSRQQVQQNVQDGLNGFRTHTDDYLQYLPLAALAGCTLSGLKGRNDQANQLRLVIKSELLVNAVVLTSKYLFHELRPDGSAYNSMPSGHTAQAFAAATLLDMEYRERSPWISVAGYLCAASTGVLRVVNNRHWYPDVLAGAGVGIATVKLVYLTHRVHPGKKQASVLAPCLLPQGGGLYFAMKF